MSAKRENWTDRASIFDVILGQYSIGQGIEIYHGREIGSHDVTMTTLHETCHLHMCSSTPFGLFQRRLGWLTGHPPVSPRLRTRCQVALNASIDQSWFTHEGVASTAELLLTLIAHGSDCYVELFSSLPEDYKKAVIPFIQFLSKLEIPVLVHNPVCDAIGYTSLATNILEDMVNVSTFERTDWNFYFNSPEKCPDHRLKMILNQLSLPDVRSELINKINELITTEFGRLSPDDFASAFADLPVNQKLRLNDKVYFTSIKEIIDRVDLKIESPYMVKKKNITIATSWAENIEGIEIDETDSTPEQDRDLSEELSILLDKIEYTPTSSDFTDKVANLTFTDREQVWNYVHSSEATLFLNILYNESDQVVGGENPLAIPPKGACLFMHACTEAKDGIRFYCPSSGIPDEDVSSPLAIVVKADELNQVIFEIKNVKHIICLKEGPHSAFIENYGKALIDGDSNRPIIIFAQSSTPSHWSNIIDNELPNGDIWYCLESIDWQNQGMADFLLAGSSNGSIVFIRPASSFALEHIKSNSANRIVSIRDVLTVNMKKQIEISGLHYYRFGW